MVVWNLEDIYLFAETDALIKQLEEGIQKFSRYRDQLSNDISVEALLALIREKEQLVELSAKLSAYADLWLAENTADPKRNAHDVRIDEVLTDAGNEILFFSLWFKSLSEKKAQQLIDGSGKYAYLLKRMYDFKRHTLSEKEEQIINLKDLSGPDTLVRLYDLVTNQFSYTWEGKKVQQPEITQHFTSADREKRKKAYALVMQTYADNEALLGELYKAIVNDWRNENVKLRNYASPLAVRNKYNDVPEKAVEALLKVVSENVSVFHDYFRLKAKVLKLEKLFRYDVYAPYDVKEKNYSYQEAMRLVLDTYQEFSPQAHAMAQQVFEKNHVHADLVENKRSGAFCYSITPRITPYVLLNHTGKPRDVATMAHELGHAIHSLSAKDQTVFTFHAELPLAETASVFGEKLLSENMLKDASTHEQISLLMQRLDETYATIIRQVFFIKFELEAHEAIAKGATVETLNKQYLNNLKDQFGSAVEVPEAFMHEWKYIPHIFHSPFYCYAYAFGNLLVLALYKMYQEQGEDFIPKYFKILGYGGSKSPGDILSEVGIDITQESFWQQGFDIIKQEVEQLRELVD